MSDAKLWGFRVSSCAERGAGHMRRCLNLAEAVGGEVTFYLDDGSWADDVLSAGFDVKVEFHRASTERLRVDLSNDSIQAVLLDSYDLVPGELALLPSRCFTAQFDDDVVAYPASSIVNAGASAPYRADIPPARQLIGPAYACLDPSLSPADSSDRIERTAARSVLIGMGARDSRNATCLAIEACLQVAELQSILVALSATAVHRESVLAFASDPRLGIIDGPERMTDLYRGADLAIGAGGLSMYERMCAGLPSIVVSLADNQASNLAFALTEKAVLDGGLLKDLTPANLASVVRGLVHDSELRSRVRDAGLRLVDGRGAERIAQQFVAWA